MRRELEIRIKIAQKSELIKPKPAPRFYLLPVINGTRIAPKPTLAQLDGELE
jgi:hypothetical protein